MKTEKIASVLARISRQLSRAWRGPVTPALLTTNSARRPCRRATAGDIGELALHDAGMTVLRSRLGLSPAGARQDLKGMRVFKTFSNKRDFEAALKSSHFAGAPGFATRPC